MPKIEFFLKPWGYAKRCQLYETKNSSYILRPLFVCSNYGEIRCLLSDDDDAAEDRKMADRAIDDKDGSEGGKGAPHSRPDSRSDH